MATADPPLPSFPPCLVTGEAVWALSKHSLCMHSLPSGSWQPLVVTHHHQPPWLNKGKKRGTSHLPRSRAGLRPGKLPGASCGWAASWATRSQGSSPKTPGKNKHPAEHTLGNSVPAFPLQCGACAPRGREGGQGEPDFFASQLLGALGQGAQGTSGLTHCGRNWGRLGSSVSLSGPVGCGAAPL